MVYEVHVLFPGYHTYKDGKTIVNCTSTLIKGPKHNVVVDTLTPFDRTKLLNGLSNHGLTPSDIDVLVCSHCHYDHIGNNNLFDKANYHIVGTDIYTKDEYITEPYFDSKKGFQIDGEDLYVFHTPGHTLDSVSVKVSTKLGVVVVAGDTFENENDADTWEVITQQADTLKQKESRNKIIAMADYIIPGHGDMFKNLLKK